jgi:hypothetical protein
VGYAVNQQAMPVGEILDLQHLLQENHTLRWDKNFYKSLLERARGWQGKVKKQLTDLAEKEILDVLQ